MEQNHWEETKTKLAEFGEDVKEVFEPLVDFANDVGKEFQNLKTLGDWSLEGQAKMTVGIVFGMVGMILLVTLIAMIVSCTNINNKG